MAEILTSQLVNRYQRLPVSQKALLAVIVLAVLLVSLYVGAKLTMKGYRYWQAWYGLQINQEAWEAGYTERGLAVPATGPRDGYWGAKLGSHTTHPQLGWILPKLSVPGMLDIDEHGMQHRNTDGASLGRLLIMGASTAFGGYASTIDKTYFALLGSLLEQASVPIDISVFATGAWKSVQEVKALNQYGLELQPDAVMFLNGLNDITNGANARALFGEVTETLDGSRWHFLYHEQDYQQRVRYFAENMRAARDRLRDRNIAVVFALQPALFEKTPLSDIEQNLEERSLAPMGSRETVREAYAALRRELTELASVDGAYFIDASRVYADEQATVFTDLWHFSDPGHRILAEYLAAQIEPVLAGLPGRGNESANSLNQID